MKVSLGQGAEDIKAQDKIAWVPGAAFTSL